MATINLKDYAFFRTEHICFIDSDEGTLPEVMKKYFNIDVDHSHTNWMIDDGNTRDGNILSWQGVLKIKIPNAEIMKIKNKEGSKTQIIEFPNVNEYVILNDYADFDGRENTYSIYCHEWSFAIQKKHSYKKCGFDFLEDVKNINFVDSSITANTANTTNNILTVYNYQTGMQKLSGDWDRYNYGVNYFSYAYGKKYNLPYVPKQPIAMGFTTDEEKSFICSNWDTGESESGLRINVDSDGVVWFNGKSFGNIETNQYFLFEQVLDATYTYTLTDGNQPYTNEHLGSFNSFNDDQFLSEFDKFAQISIDQKANVTTPHAAINAKNKKGSFSSCYYGPQVFNVNYIVTPKLVCHRLSTLDSSREYNLQELYNNKRELQMPSDFVDGIASRYFVKKHDIQKHEIRPSWGQSYDEVIYFYNYGYNDEQNNFPRWCSEQRMATGSAGKITKQSDYTVQYWIGGNSERNYLTTNLANCLIDRRWGEITTSILNYYTLKNTQKVPSFNVYASTDKFETLAIWTTSGLPKNGDPLAEGFGPSIGGGGLSAVAGTSYQCGFDNNYTFYQNLMMSISSEFNTTKEKTVRSAKAIERTGILYDPVGDYQDLDNRNPDREYLNDDSFLYKRKFYETMSYEGDYKRASWNWEFNLGQTIKGRKLVTLIVL